MSDVWITVAIGVLRCFVCVYEVITFLPKYLIEKPWKKLASCNRIKAHSVTGNPEGPYRTVDSFDQLTTSPFPGCNSLDDLFVRAVQLYGPKDCLGTRELLHEKDEMQPNGKLFRKAAFGNYHWQSYDAINSRVFNLGSGLTAILDNQQSDHIVEPTPSVCIFAETRADWIVSVFACFKANVPVVTLYATLGDDAVIHGLNESECSIVITSLELMLKVKKILNQVPSVKNLIYFDVQNKPKLDDFPNTVQVHSLSGVEALGSKPGNLRKFEERRRPTREDLAAIMYTSGSTGVPKGVLITNGNLLCGMSGQCQRVVGLGPSDTYVGYLPLAHILELSAEISCVTHGTRIGFSSPTTLSDQSTRIMKGTKGDVSVLKPTLMTAVPIIMDRLYKAVYEKVAEGGKFQRALFNYAYQYKKNKYESGYETPLIDRVIFKKVRKILGGKVRMMLCGGSPLSSDTQLFMNICFCCPVGQGYGLTETCGAGTIQEVTDRSTGRGGSPVTCCELKLVNWEEGINVRISDNRKRRAEEAIERGWDYTFLQISEKEQKKYSEWKLRLQFSLVADHSCMSNKSNYLITDQPYPRGEVWLGGGNIALGYFKNPEKTAEDFYYADGKRWFATGDIGRMEPDGSLRIIDRKKDLVKLQHGEYVSLCKVETSLKLCPLVDNVCIYAESTKCFTVALVVPNHKNLEAAAKRIGVSTDQEWHDLCSHSDIESLVLSTLVEYGMKCKLDKFELPQKVKLVSDLWTPDTGLVTEAFKLRRKNIENKYLSEIASMYA